MSKILTWSHYGQQTLERTTLHAQEFYSGSLQIFVIYFMKNDSELMQSQMEVILKNFFNTQVNKTAEFCYRCTFHNFLSLSLLHVNIFFRTEPSCITLSTLWNGLLANSFPVILKSSRLNGFNRRASGYLCGLPLPSCTLEGQEEKVQDSAAIFLTAISDVGGCTRSPQTFVHFIIRAVTDLFLKSWRQLLDCGSVTYGW